DPHTDPAAGRYRHAGPGQQLHPERAEPAGLIPPDTTFQATPKAPLRRGLFFIGENVRRHRTGTRRRPSCRRGYVVRVGGCRCGTEFARVLGTRHAVMPAVPSSLPATGR